MASYVREPAKRLKVTGSYDVVVAGGGPAGVAAAVAAGRGGAKVVLIEQTGCLGGMSTSGLVPALAPYAYTNDRPVYMGIPLETLRRLKTAGGSPEHGPTSWPRIDAEKLKRVYDQMVQEAGVEVRFFTWFSDVLRKGNKIAAVIVENKAGRQAIAGKVFIDATGDADLAARAGVPFKMGDEKGHTQSVTVCFAVDNVHGTAYWDFYKERFGKNAAMNEWLHENVAEGKLPAVANGEYRVISHVYLAASVIGYNFGHVFNVNGLDPAQTSQAMMTGRQIAENYVAFARKNIPGMQEARLAASAALLGVRETRRIRGRYEVTTADFKASRHFADDVAVSDYPVDIHATSNKKSELDRTDKLMESLAQPKDKTYGIPYRSLLPARVANLIVAGRCIATDRAVQGTARVTPVCLATGQAAGTAAAIAVKKNIPLLKVDPRLLRAAIDGEPRK